MVAQAVGHRGIGNAEHPPAAVTSQAKHRVGGQEFPRAFPDQFVGHLRGVHPDLQHREPAGRRGRVDVRIGQPLGEVGAALRHHREVGET